MRAEASLRAMNKAQFTSTPTGSNKLEICLITCVPYVAMVGYAAVRHHTQLDTWTHGLRVSLDFSALILPFVYACLSNAESLGSMHAAMIIPAVIYWLSAHGEIQISSWQRGGARLPALTQLRGIIMLQTVFCILAVDFAAFPRRFAKTRDFGTSVMDLGVGAVILSGAFPRRLRALREAPPATFVQSQTAYRVLRVVRHHLPLVSLGVCRILLVRSLEYHEAVDEYGVHWNFFFTLALVSTASVLLTPSSPRESAAASAITMILHQVGSAQSACVSTRQIFRVRAKCRASACR